MNNHPEQMQKTLQAIVGSKFTIQARKEKGQNVFDFYKSSDSSWEDTGLCIKTIFTYPKAKLFAEGIRIGLNLSGVYHE